ncbi:MAG: hypothetical protein KatS3mg090_0464 [Patescibacteria group bacterium]|nr:MAG: hypothetical protein KatS3mg090_0464 [Patescibacteria group bacterium]
MDKKFLILAGAFFLFSIFFSFALFFQDQLLSLTRAEKYYTPSAEKTIVTAYPVKIKIADNQKARIDVFVRNENDIPLKDKRVLIQTNLGTVSPSFIISDENGRASFYITSNQPGVANITAVVDNIQIQKKISVKFE